MKLLDAPTLPVLAERAGTERPGGVGFLLPAQEGFRAVSYADWWERIERVAAGLRRDGVGPRDRVLLMMESRFEWLVCDLAILCCGAWTVPVYPSLPPAQLAHPIADATPRVAIVSRPELLARLLRAAGAAERLTAVYLLDGEPPAGAAVRVEALRGLLDGPSPAQREREALRALRARIDSADPATVLYTSGTSATPKGVLLTHESILSNARMITRALTFGPSDRYLSILPLAHTLERTVHYTMIACGVTIASGRGIEALARDAAVVKPTILLGVPRLFEQMYVSVREAARARGSLARWLFSLAERSAMRRGRGGPGALLDSSGVQRPTRGIDRIWERLFFRPLRERLGGQLRYVVSGSAPLGRREIHFFCGAGLPMLEGYGLTEAGPVVSVNTFDAWRAGSVGRALPGIDLTIAEDGEILVRSPSLMAGYHNLEAESREALEGGRLHTGDLGVLDADGFLTITGRKKDMIVTSGGKNISPIPIEDRLKGSPLIQEAVVFGDRRPYLVALIVADRKAAAVQLGLDGPDRLDRQTVSSLVRKEVDRVNHDLAPHERVRSFDILEEPPSIEAGTMTPTLKVRRGALEAQCAERIAALYDVRRR